ncbi:apical junction component 1 homolog isoform X3 [Halyomorpha halys]|uniref:apical junction component 1 homolog isoform X3 n=1 Tax=Halyomorpha halys TaxID=286706 RepID=UPI0006D4F4E1|nr:apical junction component 1 homolog isoform X3 [Halyomorpha halys]
MTSEMLDPTGSKLRIPEVFVEMCGDTFQVPAGLPLIQEVLEDMFEPPENELQKVGERVMSEHELRVQRSLQRLNVPEWFKNSQVPQQGFLLKRHSEGGGTTQGWQGLVSKTTSLSSLGSRSPTGNLLSPSPTPSTHTFTRWSTTRLSSNPGSTSTSPSGSARSSFNYRQPYLGWRSQERLTHPRTPAERLAAGLLPQKQSTPPPVHNLSEVHSSIKEVTSAIVHYVSGANKDDRLSPNPPRHDSGSSRSASPRGSTGRLCWLESSFVGNRPVDVPETPVSLSATPEHAKDLYLDLNSISPGRQVNGLSERERKGSPCSATMEDVLDSLLGLTSRSPSPAQSGSASILLPPPEFANGARRLSDGCDSSSSLQPPTCPRPGRRVSFDMAVAEGELVRCRYNKCNKTATITEAKKTFKTCHNCTHVYCSRECRRAHWEKHRKTCLHSRVGALCRKVMSSIKEDEETLHHLSLVARRGFLERGRGSVKVFFSSTQNAEAFIGEGIKCLSDPSYVKWADFQPDEMGKEMHEELMRLCQNYNPDTRFILYVCVCVVSEVPTSGPVKWERELVSRCGKLKLSKGLVPKEPSPVNKEPDTLILTSLPGARDAGSRKARQVSFTNIQRHLRQRGISLRRQFPDVYQRLCSYVEGSVERFAPVTIYPRDSASGKNFMCIIMPDAEPEKLDLIPTDTTRVQTIDISTEIDSTV